MNVAYEIGKNIDMNKAEKPFDLQRIELVTIKKAMEHTNGCITEAAYHLGLNRRTLQRKLHRYFVKKPA